MLYGSQGDEKMKALKVLNWVALGVVIWSLSLVWPEINLILTRWETVGLALVFSALVLAYVMGYYHSQIDYYLQHGRDENKQKHSSRPSRPVPPLSMA
jgi:hypothetical protein